MIEFNFDQVSLLDRRVIITGANSGIGLEAAKLLAKQGAFVIMAVRNVEKGKVARDLILEKLPHAKIEIMNLDLGDLENVRVFAVKVHKQYDYIDLLINNAGVMKPTPSKTKDGFEMQFGINHLGHFALTGLLLPLLKNTPGSRVVTISSLAHKGAAIHFDNLDGAKNYKLMKFYGQSKLANLLFALELDRRLKDHGLETISIACHPGISSTGIVRISKRDTPVFIKKVMDTFLQSAEMGALPTFYAATASSLQGGEYIGPDGPKQRRGYPTIEKPHPVADDQATIKKLWDISEKLTGVTFNFSN